MESIELENLNLLCRACLSPCAGTEFNIQKLPHSLFTLFKQLASYKKNENSLFPRMLCQLCYEKLKDFDEFRLTSTKSTQRLAQLINQRKSERKKPPIGESILICQEIKKEIEDEEEKESERIKQDQSSKSVIFESAAESPLNFADDSILKRALSPEIKLAVDESGANNFEEIFIKPDTEVTETNISSDLTVNDALSCQADETSELKTECKYCHQNFDSVKALESHKCSGSNLRPYPCQLCPRSFARPSRLRKHIQENHGNPIKIICKYDGCGKVFRYQSSATSHYRLKHGSSVKEQKPKERSFMCETCGSKFHSLSNLQRHRYQHLPVESRPFQCEECGKRFANKSHFKLHLLRHAGTKNYTCPHCGAKKASSTELKAHINFHTKEKQWKCPLCPRVFNRSSLLSRHDRVVHKGIRRFACRYCELTFGKPDTLKHHEMRHTGEKPHKCNVCGRCFIQAVALKTHMKTHNKTHEIK